MSGNRTLSICFLSYFVVLLAERVQSISRIILDPSLKLFSSSYDIYVEVLSIFSMVSAVILLVFFNKSLWMNLAGRKVPLDYPMLSLTATVLLFSGMVHTEHTIPPIQFIAYGFLIVLMAIKTFETAQRIGNKAEVWYSFAYWVVFSMAIPVVYRSNMDNAGLFHVIEAIVSFALVVAFGLMLRSILVGDGKALLLWWPFLILAIGDTAVVAMRWKESVNSFVLIFASLSVILFALGKIIFGKS